MSTTFSFTLAALNVLEMLNLMRIFFVCFNKVKWYFLSIISYENSYSVWNFKQKQKFKVYLQSFFQYFSQIKYNSIVLLHVQIVVTL